MTLAELRTELQARGFDFDSTARVNNWINLAYHEVNDRHPWPYLQTTTSGTAPVTISDFGHAISVTNTTANDVLRWEDFRDIRERDPGVTATGTPESWYLDGSSLKVYPANTSDTISVHYVKVADELSDDSDSPLLPSRFHYMLIDGALSYAYRDTDEIDSAIASEERFEMQIQKMVEALLVPNYDSPGDLAFPMLGSSDW